MSCHHTPPPPTSKLVRGVCHYDRKLSYSFIILDTFSSVHSIITFLRQQLQPNRTLEGCDSAPFALQSVNKHSQPITAWVSRRLCPCPISPAAGTSETLTGTGKNRLPEGSTYWPVSGSRKPVPVNGTWNWLVCPRLQSETWLCHKTDPTKSQCAESEVNQT